jgi:hypothetical protein
LRPLSHLSNLSFATPVTFHQDLKVCHLRPLSHLRFAKYCICDACRTSGSQALSFATPVTLQALKIFHLQPLCRTSGSQTLSFAILVTLTLTCSQTPSFATPVTFQALKPSHLRPLSHLRLSKSFICDPCRTSGSQTLSFATPVTFHQALKVFHLRPLSHLRLAKYCICDACHTSGSQALSFATPVTLQALKIFHLRPLCRTSGSQALSFAITVTLMLTCSQSPSTTTTCALRFAPQHGACTCARSDLRRKVERACFAQPGCEGFRIARNPVV